MRPSALNGFSQFRSTGPVWPASHLSPAPTTPTTATRMRNSRRKRGLAVATAGFVSTSVSVWFSARSAATSSRQRLHVLRCARTRDSSSPDNSLSAKIAYVSSEKQAIVLFPSVRRQGLAQFLLGAEHQGRHIGAR